jgi:hypothetical protein
MLKFSEQTIKTDAVRTSYRRRQIELPLERFEAPIVRFPEHGSSNIVFDIYTGARYEDLQKEPMKEYITRLCLLPIPTIPPGAYRGVHRDGMYLVYDGGAGYRYYACKEYIVAPSRWYPKIIARGEPITFGGETFPYTLEGWLSQC